MDGVREGLIVSAHNVCGDDREHDRGTATDDLSRVARHTPAMIDMKPAALEQTPNKYRRTIQVARRVGRGNAPGFAGTEANESTQGGPFAAQCRSRGSDPPISADAASRGGRRAQHVRARDAQTAPGHGGGPATGRWGGRGRSRGPGGVGHPTVRHPGKSAPRPRLERERDPA